MKTMSNLKLRECCPFYSTQKCVGCFLGEDRGYKKCPTAFSNFIWVLSKFKLIRFNNMYFPLSMAVNMLEKLNDRYC